MKNNFSKNRHKGLDFKQVILIFSLLEALQLVTGMSSFPFLFPFLFPVFLYFMYLGIRMEKIALGRYWYLYLPFVLILSLSVYFNLFNGEVDIISDSRTLFITLFFALFFLVILAVIAHKLKRNPALSHIDNHLLTVQVSLVYLIYTLVFVFQIVAYGRQHAIQDVIESVWLLKVLIVISIVLKFISLLKDEAGRKKSISGNRPSSNGTPSGRNETSSGDLKICRKKLELALEESEVF